jgi:hydrogenase-4 membrane subunit HyfE
LILDNLASVCAFSADNLIARAAAAANLSASAFALATLYASLFLFNSAVNLLMLYCSSNNSVSAFIFLIRASSYLLIDNSSLYFNLFFSTLQS